MASLAAQGPPQASGAPPACTPQRPRPPRAPFVSLQVRCRDFKPMLQPALQQLVKARALQSLAGKMAKYPEMWEGHAFRVRGWWG